MIHLFLAILFLMLGYYFRMLRTLTFLQPYVNVPFTSYWRSLSLGYLAEFIFPFRVYDLTRTYFFAKFSKVSWQIPLAAIVFERWFDFFFLALISYLLSTPFFFSFIIFTILTVIIIILPTSITKKSYYYGVSFFNDKIKLFFAELFWTIFRIRNNLTAKQFTKVLSLSILIWISYLASIYFLSHIMLDMSTLISYQFKQISPISIWNIFNNFSHNNTIVYFVYIITPISLSFIIGYIVKDQYTKQYNFSPYKSDHDKLDFYNVFFTDFYTEEIEKYYKITHTGIRLADLSAASDAKTYLIEENQKIFIRKIALSSAKEKLFQQYQWLCENSHLPIPEIYNYKQSPHLFMYDMEYFSGDSFFRAIHTMPIERSFEIIKNILYLFRNNYTPQPVDIRTYTDQYFDLKVINNRQILLKDSYYSDLAQYPFLEVNSTKVPNVLHPDTIELMREYNQTINDPIYLIHGDLTIENILVNSQQQYMIIDPSPIYINIFAEYSKFFQSLHGKYEHIKRASFEYSANIITYSQYATIQYEKLYYLLREDIIQEFGMKKLKTVYFYEAICHIRTAKFMLELENNQAILMLALAGNALQKWKEIEV